MHHTWSVMTGLFLVAVTGTKMVSPAWGGARPMTAPTAPLSQPCEVEAQLHVVRLPNTPVVDMTKPLPSIPGALVEVAELGVKARTDTEGNARFHLELNPGSCERVYTFVVTIPASAHQSVTRLLIPKAAPNWRLFFDPTRDLYADDSFTAVNLAAPVECELHRQPRAGNLVAAGPEVSSALAAAAAHPPGFGRAVRRAAVASGRAGDGRRGGVDGNRHALPALR
jgi:hypothetical protein